jgi:hypothetical protein
MKKLALAAALVLLAVASAQAGKVNSPYDDQAVSKGAKPAPLAPPKCQPSTGADAGSLGNKEAQNHPGQRNFDCMPEPKVEQKFNRHAQ